MSDTELPAKSRPARGAFAAMAMTYGPGVFNDSLYREAAMLMAVAAGLATMQGWVMFIFTVPYLLFASPAGWLADRFPKRRVIIGAKTMELTAILLGAVGICTGNWPLIFSMVFAMGLQACLFSPSLNGSIPELYPHDRVTAANAKLKVAVTAAILAGISSAGFVLAHKAPGWWGIAVGRWGVAIIAVSLSSIGLISSLFMPRRPPADPRVRFPWWGPFDTLRELARIRGDSLLWAAMWADVFVWSVGALLMQLINLLALKQLGRDEAMAGYLIAAQVIGVAAGGLIGGRVAVGPRWYWILPAALGAMGVSMAAVAFTPLAPPSAMLPVLFALMGVIGIAGGMCVIPCEGFVQVRAAPERKGAVIASVNFAVFAGISLSGPAANGLALVPVPTQAFAVVGVMALLLAGWLGLALTAQGSSEC